MCHSHEKNLHMSKIFYKYNPHTLSYERVFVTVKQRIWTLFRHIFIGIVIGSVLFAIATYMIDSPQERLLQKNYNLLLTQYQILSKNIDENEKILNELRQRDENLYRIMFNADPIPQVEDERKSLYNQLLNIPNASLVISTALKLDNMTHQLYMQSRSYDDLIELIKTKEDRVKNIPAIMPLSSKQMKGVSSGFGMRLHPIFGDMRMHTGIDLNAMEGTPIYATGGGVVEFTGWEGGYGNTVIINHGFGYKTRYGHCKQLKVRVGQKVVRGQLVATVGMTGTAKGYHVHYEVLVKGQYDNPAKYFFMDLTPEEYDKMLYEAEHR